MSSPSLYRERETERCTNLKKKKTHKFWRFPDANIVLKVGNHKDDVLHVLTRFSLDCKERK